MPHLLVFNIALQLGEEECDESVVIAFTMAL